MNAFRTHPSRIPYCNPYIIHKHKIPLSRRENEATHNRLKRSIGCPRAGTSKDSRKKEGHVHTFQERTKGLVGHPELENKLPFKNGTKTRSVKASVTASLTYRFKFKRVVLRDKEVPVKGLGIALILR